MPITLTRVEPGIYHSQLTGTIQLEELIDSQQQGLDLAVANNEAQYVLVIEIDRSTQMPFDIRQAGRLVENDRSSALLTVGAGFHIRFLVGLLGRLFGIKNVEHYNSVDDAVKRAREVLKKPQNIK